MPHRIFYSVDLEKWVYGTIEKLRLEEGMSWNASWYATYLKLGGKSKDSGTKSCPRSAAKTLYEFGRIKDKNGGLPFRDCDVSEMWDHPDCGRNGAYAILATRLLCKYPKLRRTAPWPEIKKALWPEIQEVVRCEVEFDDDDGPASNENDEVRLTWQLWHLGLIVDQSA